MSDLTKVDHASKMRSSLNAGLSRDRSAGLISEYFRTSNSVTRMPAAEIDPGSVGAEVAYERAHTYHHGHFSTTPAPSAVYATPSEVATSMMVSDTTRVPRLPFTGPITATTDRVKSAGGAAPILGMKDAIVTFAPSAAIPLDQQVWRECDTKTLVESFTSPENIDYLAGELGLEPDHVLMMAARWNGLYDFLQTRSVVRTTFAGLLYELNDVFIREQSELTNAKLYWAEDDFYNGPYGVNKGPLGAKVNQRTDVPADYATSSTRSTKQRDFQVGGFADRPRVRQDNVASRGHIARYMPGTDFESQWTEFGSLVMKEASVNKRSTQIKRSRAPAKVQSIYQSCAKCVIPLTVRQADA